MNIHVVTSPCLNTKDTACARVCPVSCFYDAGDMLLINPGECIGCGICVSECPVSAIFPEGDVPEHDREFIGRAQTFFATKTASELDRIRVNP